MAVAPAKALSSVAHSVRPAKPGHPSALPLSASALLAGLQPQGTVVSDMVAASETTPLPPAPTNPTSSMVPVTQFPPPLNPSPRPTSTASTEVVSKRTANSVTFDNHNGSMTTKVSQGMNYHTPSGYQPVDPSFHAPGTGMTGVSAIENHSDVTVSVSPSGIAALGPEGTGIRILTPGLPAVAGSVASTVLGGMSWKFTPTGSGLEAAAMVSSRQGARSYSFNVALLGGAKALSVDGAGNLVSGAFSLSRPLVVGADGGMYPTGAWSVSGSTITFSFSDVALPSSAIPYVIDPNLKWSFAAAGGASFVNSSSTYGSGGSVSTVDGGSYFAISDNHQPDNSYVIADAAMNFDTSTIPANAFPEIAKINVFSCSSVQSDANESLMLDFSTDPNLTPGDQYPDTQPGRFGSALVSQFGSAPNPTACIFNWAGGAGAVQGPFADTTISGTVPGVTVAGTTTVQLKVANRSVFPSSPAPGGQNGIYLTGYAATQNYRPSLEVTWALPVPAPAQISPQPGPAFTMTPTLAVQGESDPDGDTPVYYLMAVYNTATITNGTLMWSTSPQWQTATSTVVPAGVLLPGTNYWWEGCAWDHIDLTSRCTGLLGPFTTPQTLPTPVQVSPANGATVAPSPTLSANPVSDPNQGGVVTYAFKVSTTANLASVPAVMSTSPSYQTSGLSPATTYYWAVSAQDQFGMTSPLSPVWSFHIQPPAPTISASIPPAPAWNATTTVTATWSDAAPVTGYSYVFDHAPATDPGTVPTSTTQVVQAVSAGVWYLHVRAVDAAGAWSAIATQQYNIAPMACATCTAASIDGAGLKSFYPYQSFALGGPSTAYANLANGNLVVQTTPLSLPGMGLNLILEATYNLLRDPATPGATDTVTSGPLGPGWTLAISEGADASAGMLDAPDMVDIGRGLTSTATNAFDFYDASGTHQVFYADVTGTWHSPPGINLTMSSGSDLFGPWYRLVRPDGVVYEYREIQGTGFRLSSISDIKGDFLVFSYAPAPGFPSGQLTSVSEGAGGQAPRTLAFTWSGTTLTQALFSAGGQSEETDFGFNGSGRLSSVTQAGNSADAATTGFGYNAAGLASVTDPSGHASSFSVTSGRITQFSDRAAEPWGIAYGGTGCSPDNAGVAATCVTQPGVATPTVYSLSAQANMVASRDAGDVDASGHARTNLSTYAWAANRLSSMTDPAGNSTSYGYNGYGQVTQAVHAGAGPTLTTTVSYQAVTPTGSTQISWLGLLPVNETITAPGVSELTSSTSGVGTPAPRTQRFTYYDDTTLASATDPTLATTSFGYVTATAGHPLGSVTDPDGHTTAYANYDASGQPGTITDASSTVTSLGYDFLGDLATSTNVALGLTTRHAYNLRGEQVSVTDPLGNTTLSCFDRNGNVTATVGPLSSPTTTCSSPSLTGSTAGFSGSVAATTYDLRDLVSATVTNADGAVRKSVYSYFANGQLSGILEPRSFSASTGAPVSPVQQVTYALYPDNRPASMTDEAHATTTETYTPDGRIATVTEPPSSSGRQVVTSYAYNWWGEPTSTMVSGHTAPTLDTYDVFGEKTKETDPSGATVTTTYDADGRVLTQTQPVTGTTVPTATVTNAYDPAGNLTQTVQPSGAGASTTVAFTYTPLNQLASETDPGDSLHKTSFAYDPAGRQTARSDTYNGPTVIRNTAFAYDAGGRLTTETATGTGLTTVVGAFAYDADGNVTATSTTAGGASSPNVASLRMSYTSADELKAVTETDFSPTATAVTKSSAYAYDQDGQVTSATTDALAAAHTYNLDGTEATTSAPAYGTVASSYFPNGALATETMPGTVLATQAYDAAGRLASKVVTGPGGAALSSWNAIVYDQADRVSQTVVSTAQPGGTTGAWTGRFAYTAAGFLSKAQGPTDAGLVAYSPDDAGNDRSTASSSMSYANNRLTQSVSVPTGTATTYQYDHLGEQVTQTSGSSVTTTVYDAAGHPQKVTSPDGSWVAYAYDIGGRLISRQESTASTPAELDFYGGRGSQIIESTDVSGTSTAAYLLDSSGTPVAQQTTANGPGTWSSFVTDIHDNDAQLVDTSGHVVAAYAYDVLGNAVSQTASSGSSSRWTSRLKFQMAPVDPKLGVYNLGPRLLDPTIGRFTSADNWVAAEADLALQTDPLTGDRYLYAGANPAGMIDNGYSLLSAVGHFLKKSLHNSVVRGIVTTVAAGAICAGTAGAGCLVVAGAAVGAGLKLADYQANSAHHSLSGYLGAVASGAGEGALTTVGGGEGAPLASTLEGQGERVAAKTAEDVAVDAAKSAEEAEFPAIKAGSAGGNTAGEKFPEAIRKAALDENPSRCVYCRMETDAPQVDHAIPRSRGGDATLDNAQTTCGHCNASKGARDFPRTPPSGYRGPWPPPWWP